MVTERWKAIDPEQKLKFEQQAKEDYSRYAEEMKQYRQRPEVQNVLVDPQSSGNKRRCKFIGVAKRPLSGYNIFFREEHARIKSLTKSEVGAPDDAACMTVVIAKKWSELSDAEKAELNKRAADAQKAAEEQEAARESVLTTSSLALSLSVPHMSLILLFSFFFCIGTKGCFNEERSNDCTCARIFTTAACTLS
jgi:hypothetical protein